MAWLGLAACGGPCATEPNAPSRPVEPAVEAPAPVEPLPEVPPLPPEVLRGVCYAHAYQDGGARGYGSETSRRTLEELREHAVGSVSLTPFGFLPSLGAHEIRHADSIGASETDERTRREIEAAHAAGHSVMLKPHLWVARGEWRARLDPAAGWDAFFDSYEPWMVGYARLAAETGVEWLVIGTELRSSLGQEERWRRLIAAVRSVYEGELVYAANWDAMDSVPFWDALDALGIQFYPPVAHAEGETTGAMRERLRGYFDRLAELSTQHERPVIFTEIGYRSATNAALRPHEWTDGTDAEVDLELQRTLYTLFFAEAATRDYVRGVYLWKWFTDPDSREEGPTGFSPAGKPAAEVMRTAYAISGE
ncbi:MAG: hypothetical protein JJ863_00285 [Deltaproteobacteria bacterium]|nr:hypothetical protein [Deltaproteobacteria bacterium]